ncbi:uncharacterized protein LOC131094991 [Melospiza georgiana]|uniref:uncharacterized protein LOC131094991 n=1 Tax=Melospiza georgiana TaxID=44398 RepID=UPI0025ACDB86|nr:uncharacterized protein LOC131094991 [Melospiza georgiana]
MLYHMVCPAHSPLPQSPGAALALGYSSPRASHQLYPIGRGLSPPPPFPGVEITRDQTLDLFSPPGPPWSDSTIKVGFLVPRRRAPPVLYFGPFEIVRPGVQSCRTRPPQRSWVNLTLPFPYSKSHNPCPVPVFPILLLVLHFHFCIPCLTPIFPFPLSLLYSCSQSQSHLPNPCPIFSVWFLFPYSLSHSNILVPSPIPGPSPIFSIPFPVPVLIPVPVPISGCSSNILVLVLVPVLSPISSLIPGSIPSPCPHSWPCSQSRSCPGPIPEGCRARAGCATRTVQPCCCPWPAAESTRLWAFLRGPQVAGAAPRASSRCASEPSLTLGPCRGHGPGGGSCS